MKKLFLLLYIYSSVTIAETIILQTGESKKLAATGPIWVENGQIIKVADLGTQYQVSGLNPGSSKIKIAEKNYFISVLLPSQIETFHRLQKIMPQTLGLRLKIDHGQVLVAGHLVQYSDWAKIYKSCADTPCQYLMAANINSHLEKKVRINLLQQFKKMGIHGPKLEFGNPYTMRIPRTNLKFEDLKLIAKKYGIRLLEDKESLEAGLLIKVQITIAEIKKSASKKFGIAWPATYQAQIIPSFQKSTEASFVLANFLENQGLGKVLASPNILCRSGKEAEFFAGGEFPVPVINHKMRDILWKKYGISMKIKPLADDSGRMSIHIETEVSSIDGSRVVNNIPAIFTNRIQSHFDLNEPKTIALSGLIKSEEHKSSEGLPGLGQIPILGALFASKDFREEKSELVIFVRPEIVSTYEDQI